MSRAVVLVGMSIGIVVIILLCSLLYRNSARKPTVLTVG
jgi:hypothetical protein